MLLEEASLGIFSILTCLSGLGTTSRATNATGIQFNLSTEGQNAIQKLGTTANSVVLLQVDPATETTKLYQTIQGVQSSELSTKIPKDQPFFAFYNLGGGEIGL